MKKFLLIAISLLSILALAVGISACAPHEHSFSEWEVVTAPTCTEAGEEQSVCTCGRKETREILPLWHDYVDSVCTRCGEELVPTDNSYFTFTELYDGSYSIIWNGITQLPNEIVIPWEYNGKPVKQLGEAAFSDCDSLTSVTIPDSLTSIGEYAFFWCTNLINISIPGGVTSIGYQAFAGCENLQSVSIPSSVTSIGNYAFYGCIRLETLSIPSSITSIGSEAFSNCDSLTSAVFESADGWSAGGEPIAAADLSDPATAAKYLRYTYYRDIWTRS